MGFLWFKRVILPSVVPHVLRKSALLFEEQPISIKSSIVDIAHDYTKKRFVFRLTTYSGSTYLLQADTNDDMLRWIQAIKQNDNPDQDVRQQQQQHQQQQQQRRRQQRVMTSQVMRLRGSGSVRNLVIHHHHCSDFLVFEFSNVEMFYLGDFSSFVTRSAIS